MVFPLVAAGFNEDRRPTSILPFAVVAVGWWDGAADDFVAGI
jgi:hypothetical protein